jgi:hypothetical protein
MSAEIDLATELAAVKAQLKEQTQQMAEMASMMKSMMSLAMPLLEEQTRKLRNEKEAEAARKKEEEAEAARLEEMRSWPIEYRNGIGYRKEPFKESPISFSAMCAGVFAAATRDIHTYAIAPAKEIGPDSSPDWSCPDDGYAHEWVHAGKQYVRNAEGGVWEYDGECVGEWAGQWDPRTKTIDMTVFEPEFDE